MGSLTLKQRGNDDTSDISPILQAQLKQGQMIAVACEDTWYPAVVERDNLAGGDVTVSFGELGKTLGTFRWPTGKDIHTVSRRRVVSTNVVHEPRAGGRSWFVTNASEIQRMFKMF
ncbi:hypothetical protein PoB_001981100 [Plakobranchus ocellatus]|uniref:Uncharacterized protein n=1 Tax=Plakobranchus ocellatus TaxID=259542 RepID=A0AAV3Z1W0_9GAST|nr:hypothetical protein PoB_001981100 [Plakobranchus ocellatus]